MLKSQLTILTILLCFAFAKGQFSEWELEKEGDGIEVYTRAVEGSDIREFKAITYISKPMSFLEALIENADKYKSWQENVNTSQLLEQVNPTDMYIYYTTELPWPISDRDVALFSRKTISDNGTVTYSMVCTPEYLKESEEFLRIKIARGVWKFTPVKNDQIQILFQFYGDPGGMLPDWIINLFLVSGPYGTLQNMKNLK